MVVLAAEPARGAMLRTPSRRREGTHSNIWKMFEDIVEHTRNTGDRILSSDYPRDLLIGFQALQEDGSLGKEWTISISGVKRSMILPGCATVPEWKVGLVAKALKTSEGRAKLAQSFPGQRQRFNPA